MASSLEQVRVPVGIAQFPWQDGLINQAQLRMAYKWKPGGKRSTAVAVTRACRHGSKHRAHEIGGFGRLFHRCELNQRNSMCRGKRVEVSFLANSIIKFDLFDVLPGEC